MSEPEAYARGYKLGQTIGEKAGYLDGHRDGYALGKHRGWAVGFATASMIAIGITFAMALYYDWPSIKTAAVVFGKWWAQIVAWWG